MDRGLAVALTAVVGGLIAPEYLTGGLLGAAYVTCVLVTVRSLGVDKDPLNAMKAIGVLLLAAGTLLVVRG